MVLQSYTYIGDIAQISNESTARLIIPVAVSVGFLLLWRIWTFVILPQAQPHAPKLLPYWFPFIGHTFSFLKSSELFLTSARKKCGNSRSPFAVTLAGTTVYVITNPRDVSEVYNNKGSLTYESFLGDIMSSFGTSARGVEKILQRKPLIHANDNPCHKSQSISQIAHDLQVRQTQGKDLKILGEYFEEFVQQCLSIENMTDEKANLFAIKDTDSSCILSLKRLTAEVFINAGQKTYFGEVLSDINPALPYRLIEFDELSWQVFYEYPKRLRRRLNRISEEILDSLNKYLELPPENRQGKAWFTNALEHEFRKAHLSNDDIASQMLLLYWGINTNMNKISFWLVVHILSTPDLAESIRAEIQPAFRADGSIDGSYTYSSCPRLNGLWLETLRMSANSTAVRNVTADTKVGDKLLRKNHKILISARQLHFSSIDFGPNVDNFDPNRFLKNSNLHHSPAFRPFGGGPTLCPGRYLAKYMALAFVALLLQRFDVSIAAGPKPCVMPTYRESKPGIGISAGEGDLQIRLTVRSISNTAVDGSSAVRS